MAKSALVPSASKSTPPVPFFTDRPIRLPQHDELGLAPFVERLVRPLLDWPPSDGLVVGLYAAWGSGKTSTLNLLEDVLQNEANKKRVLVARFNPWLFRDEAALLTGFFAMMQDAMNSTPFLTVARRKMARTGLHGMNSFFTPWIASVVQAHTGIPNLATSATSAVEAGIDAAIATGEASFDSQKAKVVDALSHLRAQGRAARLVVLIDDLDRVEPPEARAMLKLIRLIADLPNVTYVVAMDYERVQGLISDDHNAELGRAYLEKIIQIPITLPRVSRSALGRLVLEGMNAIFSASSRTISTIEVECERRGIELDTYILWRVKTLRDRARFLNVLRFNILSAENPLDVNHVDAFLVALLQTFYPTLLNRLRDNKEFLTGDDSLITMIRISAAREEEYTAQRKKALFAVITGQDFTSELVPQASTIGAVRTGGVDVTLTYEQERLRALVLALFPNAEAAAEVRRNALVEWRRTNRIASPDRFDRYFSALPPQDEIGDAYVDAWLLAAQSILSSPPSADRCEAILGSLRQCPGPKRPNFLAKIQDRLPDVQIPLLGPLTEAIAVAASEGVFALDSATLFIQAAFNALQARQSTIGFGDEDNLPLDSEEVSQFRLLAHQAFARLVRAEPSVGEALIGAGEHINRWAIKERKLEGEPVGTSNSTLVLPVVLIPVVEAALERITQFLRNDGDLTDDVQGQHFSAAIWRWRDLLRESGDDFSSIKTYLRALLSRNPEKLPLVLTLFAGWSDDLPTYRSSSYKEIQSSVEEIVGWCALMRGVVRYEQLDGPADGPYSSLVRSFRDRVRSNARRISNG